MEDACSASANKEMFRDLDGFEFDVSWAFTLRAKDPCTLLI